MAPKEDRAARRLPVTLRCAPTVVQYLPRYHIRHLLVPQKRDNPPYPPGSPPHARSASRATKIACRGWVSSHRERIEFPPRHADSPPVAIHTVPAASTAEDKVGVCAGGRAGRRVCRRVRVCICVYGGAIAASHTTPRRDGAIDAVSGHPLISVAESQSVSGDPSRPRWACGTRVRYHGRGGATATAAALSPGHTPRYLAGYSLPPNLLRPARREKTNCISAYPSRRESRPATTEGGDGQRVSPLNSVCRSCPGM